MAPPLGVAEEVDGELDEEPVPAEESEVTLALVPESDVADDEPASTLVLVSLESLR